MQLNRAEVRAVLIESILEILQGDGRGEIPSIDDRTNPIRDLGLASQDGIEIACLLSYKLKFEIPPEVNPFVDDTRHRARRMGEIVDLLVRLLEQKGVADHV